MKRLLCLVIALMMVLSVLPVVAMAEFESVVLAADTVEFDSYDAAFDGVAEAFTTETNGEVTVKILSCTPGYYIDLYANGDWREDFTGYSADTMIFSVTAGVEYEILLCTYNLDADDFEEGSIKYEISFLSNGEVPEEPVDPSLLPGGTPENPLAMTGTFLDFIEPGRTIWFLYDNTQNMTDNGVYSMMLHVASGAGYSATFGGEDLPVDEFGFLNYEMVDTDKTGLYLFSITNNLTEKKFFTITVEDKPEYIILDQALKVGSNRITLNADYPYTLMEFTPASTGIYQFRSTTAQCKVGDYGTIYNPMDNTPNKTSVVTWTCTAVGQSVLISFSGARTATCIVSRTGDYIPPPEVEWTIYENTYDFSYTVPTDNVQTIDLTDGNEHSAVLGSDGFYHYGSAEGPLMVANLSTAPINFADAYANGGLRVWITNDKHETISKVDYNEAMNEYYQAGLVPVTEELVMMFKALGESGAWWNANGLIFGENAPENTDIAWMQLCGYLVEISEYAITGAVVTGDEGDVTLELLFGGEVIATTTASGKEGTYTLTGITDGTYSLRISQKNHVTREYTITVEGSDLTQDVKIHLIGDIDGNGKINVGDVAKLNGHIKNTNPLTDDYALLCANVNGGSLNMGDTAALYGHIKGTKNLY